MKKSVFYYVCLFLIPQWSCQKAEWMDSQGDPSSSEVVMEVNIHQTIIDQYEEPDPELHADFIGNELKSVLSANRLKVSSNSSEYVDTIFTYEEIPLIRETRSQIKVYEDGRSEMQLEDLTPEGINTLYQLTETPPDNEMILSKTLIKDGRMKVYNKNNELMLDDEYPESNLRGFVDSLQQLCSVGESASKVKGLYSKAPPGVKFTSIGNGRVRIEQEISGTPPGQAMFAPGTSLRAVAELDEKMSQTVKFEIFSNQQLIHRKTFEYEDNSRLKNYVGNNAISDNPRTILSETLQLNKVGRPVIYRSTTLYHVNSTVLKSKTK